MSGPEFVRPGDARWDSLFHKMGLLMQGQIIAAMMRGESVVIATPGDEVRIAGAKATMIIDEVGPFPGDEEGGV